MKNKRLGRQTIEFGMPPVIAGAYSIAGYKEGEGPLSLYFDKILDKKAFKDITWEKAESNLQKEAAENAIKKAGITPDEVDYIVGGDLLNQCSGTNYGLRDIDIPFIGLYGACSTMALGLSVASMLIDGGFANNLAAVTSSHFCSAEKQYRFPLEYGGQRPQTSQWTITGSGSVVLSKEGTGPKITHVTTGKILDMGITDANNMGPAMAPAFCQTLAAHLAETGRKPLFYDLIVSGDLGLIGKKISIELMKDEGYDLSKNYFDCGAMIFNIKKQDVHSGGSGCGCSALVLCGYIYKEMLAGNLKNVLFCATGALMNPTSIQQGESIPAVAHAVAITNG